MTLETIRLASFLLGASAFGLLSLFSLLRKGGGDAGRSMLLAVLATLAFILSHYNFGITRLTGVLEFLVLFAWIGVLTRIIGLRTDTLQTDVRPVAAPSTTDTDSSGPNSDTVREFYSGEETSNNTPSPDGSADAAVDKRAVRWLFAISGALTIAGIVFNLFGIDFRTSDRGALSTHMAILVLLSIAGLAFLEQVIRNTQEIYRWRLRYLYIGLSVVFAFELVLHASGLLLQSWVASMWVLQPAILGLAAPFLAVASRRNRTNPLRLNLSRSFVFRGGVFVATGLFLLGLGVFGYYVRLFGGDWGTATGMFVASVALAAFVTVMGSSKARAYLRVLISKTFYEYKYDYRDEWMRATNLLAEPDSDYSLGQQVLRSLANVLHVNAGALWRMTDTHSFLPHAQLATEHRDPLPPAIAATLATYFARNDWILDLTSEDTPAALQDVVDWATDRNGRYVVPLFVNARLFGVAMLNDAPAARGLGWEDFDLIRLVANQSAAVLALQQTADELSEGQRLRAVTQVSAFLVHDLKTVGAQLSLMLENAERHKSNPAFVDDMISTTENAVTRINHLLSQLRREPESAREPVSIAQVLKDALADVHGMTPAPDVSGATLDARIHCNRPQLATAIGHLLRNSIDATPPDGHVDVLTKRDGDWLVLSIRDTGSGMSPEFIENELFQPFTSTKGLTGMGIGAYQARETIREHGGDIQVDSKPGAGSTFSIRLRQYDGQK